ncbi:hypothetical protein [Chryseobacterium luquanense]|uniref:Hemolytic protein HlpA-like protein n=1 Tax=Chryseobacterium luquanense TaxID=2983766 RepID=A0ABT3Y051_9FLAO|nr:hypothetical protein [Chryseobacterium luquanense]MCX8531515.1 hypothetical protein [Chryseobacterium luquanense]
MEAFDIPIVIFFFKRTEKTVQIVREIAKVKPQKIYLISDGARNEEEAKIVNECRHLVEKEIFWDCEIIKNYAETNQGVYNRIAEGSLWVFSQEDLAIFLEDDNLPEISFFPFCKELLEKYKHDSRVLWICGTNYLKQYHPLDGASYVFTQHMLPCGWASWADKFTKFYDGKLELWKNNDVKKKIDFSYSDKKLMRQDMISWDMESERIEKSLKPISWDYQMSFSIRAHGLYGIVPKYNQIRNIGVDAFSTHGGSSLSFEMTKRFCELETKKMKFPLVHPKVILCDPEFETRTGKIILYPLKVRLRRDFSILIKKIFRLDKSFELKKIFSK